jgi:hypothetical protein
MDGQGAARRPTTFLEVVSAYPDITEARERFEELALRIALAGDEPLTLAEYLEAVATGEALATHYRHRARVHGALLAGATWAQIADATATTEARARRDYREWAAGEHRMWVDTGHEFGLDEAEYAAAIARADT